MPWSSRDSSGTSTAASKVESKHKRIPSRKRRLTLNHGSKTGFHLVPDIVNPYQFRLIMFLPVAQNLTNALCLTSYVPVSSVIRNNSESQINRWLQRSLGSSSLVSEYTTTSGYNLCRNGRKVKHVRVANINPIMRIWADAILTGDTAEVCRAVLDIATVE